MTKDEVRAIKLMAAAFPQLSAEDEAERVNAMTRAEAIAYLVHSNTVPFVKLLLGSDPKLCGGISHDFTSGAVMDVLTKAAADWLDGGRTQRFVDYANGMARSLFRPYKYLTQHDWVVSLDAPLERGAQEGKRQMEDVLQYRIDRSYAAGVARSLRGVVYSDELDATVVRKERRTRVAKDPVDLADTGFAAEERRRQELREARMSPYKTLRVADRAVGLSKSVRRRLRTRYVGFNGAMLRYMGRKREYVPVCGVVRSCRGSEFPEWDNRVNVTAVRELPESCSGCRYMAACLSWTVSRCRFFTLGLRGAVECGLNHAGASTGGM